MSEAVEKAAAAVAALKQGGSVHAALVEEKVTAARKLFDKLLAETDPEKRREAMSQLHSCLWSMDGLAETAAVLAKAAGGPAATVMTVPQFVGYVLEQVAKATQCAPADEETGPDGKKKPKPAFPGAAPPFTGKAADGSDPWPRLKALVTSLKDALTQVEKGTVSITVYQEPNLTADKDKTDKTVPAASAPTQTPGTPVAAAKRETALPWPQDMTGKAFMEKKDAEPGTWGPDRPRA